MSRKLVFRLTVAAALIAVSFLLWSLFYSIVVALRFRPEMAGEGASAWGLLKQQGSESFGTGLFVAAKHFWDRIIFPDTRPETLVRAAIAGFMVVAAMVGLWVAQRVTRKPMPYGAARFGNLFDAERVGLTSRIGLVTGYLAGKLLRSDDPAHVLVVGPTRSGKGVSFVLPNGFSWHGSSVWFDPKRENVHALAGYRKSIGDKVFVFTPGERDTNRYNPLDFIRRDERMATDCLVVASFLIPDDNKEIWGRSARLLLAAMIGYVIAEPALEQQRTLRSVADLTTTQSDFQTVLRTIVKHKAANIPPWIIASFNQFIAIEPETRNSALFNVTTALGPWNNDLIAETTSSTDFDLRNFRRERIALFIGCSVAQLDVFRPLIKLLVQQIHDQLMAAMPGPDEPYKVLMMIDEFRQLGRMDDLVSKLTINAGYGFRMCLILQDLSQLDELYGKAARESTVAACQVKLFIRINDQATSDYVSDMLGSTTEEISSPMYRSGQGFFTRKDRSIHYAERPLRSPQELREMPSTTAILMVPNCPAFELRKVLYYEDQPFKKVALASKAITVAIPSVVVKPAAAQPSLPAENAANTAVQPLAPNEPPTPEPEPKASASPHPVEDASVNSARERLMARRRNRSKAPSLPSSNALVSERVLAEVSVAEFKRDARRHSRETTEELKTFVAGESSIAPVLAEELIENVAAFEREAE